MLGALARNCAAVRASHVCGPPTCVDNLAATDLSFVKDSTTAALSFCHASFIAGGDQPGKEVVCCALICVHFTQNKTNRDRRCQCRCASPGGRIGEREVAEIGEVHQQTRACCSLHTWIDSVEGLTSVSIISELARIFIHAAVGVLGQVWSGEPK